MQETHKERCAKMKNPKSCYRCVSIIEQLFACPDLSDDDRGRIEKMRSAIGAGYEITSAMARKLEKLKDFYLE